MQKPRLRGAARRAHGSSAEHAMRDLIASNAPLRNGSHKARQNGPKHYPGDSTGAANRGPAKAQRSGFGGERRSSGTTELLPRKAKRRMWSLRRRGTPFSSIFRRATKDGAVGDRWFSRAASKNVKRKIPPPVDVGLAVRSVKPPHQFPCHQINQIPNPRSGGIEDQILHLADPGPEYILTHLNIK